MGDPPREGSCSGRIELQHHAMDTGAKIAWSKKEVGAVPVYFEVWLCGYGLADRTRAPLQQLD